jgi:hypothetical protein
MIVRVTRGARPHRQSMQVSTWETPARREVGLGSRYRALPSGKCENFGAGNVLAAAASTPAISNPVSLRRIRADAIRANAMVVDDDLCAALDLVPRAQPKLSAQVPRDAKGRSLPDPEPPVLDLEPIRAILERHGLGDAISPGSPSAATVEREVGKSKSQRPVTGHSPS